MLKFFTFGALMLGAAAAQALTIHGSTTVDSNLFQPHKAQLEAETGLTLDVVANGSSRGIQGLEAGAADMGMISSTLESTLGKLEMAERAAEFTASQVGETRVIFAVHPTNEVSALTKDQVVSILKGETTNWSAVGGADLPIVTVTEYEGGGFRTTVEKKLLAKESIAGEVRALPNGSQVVTVGAQLPNAFVVVSKNMVKGDEVKRLETDAEVVQPLILVTKGTPNDDAQKLIDSAAAILAE